MERPNLWGAAPFVAIVATVCCGTGSAGAPGDAGAAISAPAEGASSPSPPSPSADPVPATDGGDASSATLPSAACVSYCDLLMPTCAADYPQFGSTAACLNACAFYPPGTDGDPINEGNTLKCRVFHTSGGGGHCLHGGPYGYDGCGSMCEGFCQLAMGWCSQSKTGAPFPSLAACQSTCVGWAWAPTGPDGAASYRATSPTTGNTLECREVQLTMSLESAAARDTYCPLAADDSVPCR